MLSLGVSLALLAALLSVAVTRPRLLPEWLVALVAAAVVLVVGAVSSRQAVDEVETLGPVLLFLAAILLLGRCCAAEGVFRALGGALSQVRSSQSRLLLAVCVVSALVTSVLSLDATVVLLTPVVLAAAAGLGVQPRAFVYAVGHVANSGSLLLPTGNLTNLLALSATGLTLVHFAGLMALPWLLVVGVEYLVISRFCRADLTTPVATPDPDVVDSPWFALAVLGSTLVGFVVTSIWGVPPYWSAIVGALVLAGHCLARGLLGPVDLARAVDPAFVCFVIGLAIVVRAAVASGVGRGVDRLLPSGEGLAALLVFAVVAAVLANVVNNLPALLVVLPTAAAVGPPAVLAVLIGVNIGPNLTYTGSLATLLWRRVLHAHDEQVPLGEFTLLGLLTVPLALVLAVVGLWAAAGV